MFSLQTKNQGVTEELKCLKLLNKLEDTIAGGQIPEEVRVFMEPCMKVADSIKSYISKVSKRDFLYFIDFMVKLLFQVSLPLGRTLMFYAP